MKEENLKAIFCSFIEHRQRDDVDTAYCGGGDISEVEFDNPLPCTDWSFPHQSVLPPFSPQNFAVASLTTAQLNVASSIGRRLSELASAQYSSEHDKSNISFESCSMIVAPEEQNISVCIIRSDSCANRVTKVEWKTCDKTAQSGIHYVGSTGEIVFNESETKKTIEIKILKSVDEAIDLRFKVELNDVNGVFNPKPLTITLKKTDNFYPDEKEVLNSLPQSLPFTIEAVRFALGERISPRSFHVAVSHLCSSEEAVHVQFALAFELGRLCLKKLSKESILHVLSDYFRMDDIDF